MIGKLGILAGAAALQATVFAQIRVGGGPDFVLVALIIWAARLRLRDCFILTFGGGLFLDLLSLLPTGSTALGLLPAIFVLDYWKEGLSRISFPILMFTVWLATVGKSFALLLVAAQMGYEVPLSQASDIAFVSMLYNSFIMLLYFLFSRIRGDRLTASPTANVT